MSWKREVVRCTLKTMGAATKVSTLSDRLALMAALGHARRRLLVGSGADVPHHCAVHHIEEAYEVVDAIERRDRTEP